LGNYHYWLHHLFGVGIGKIMCTRKGDVGPG
jgi:hypothetical protein